MTLKNLMAFFRGRQRNVAADNDIYLFVDYRTRFCLYVSTWKSSPYDTFIRDTSPVYPGASSVATETPRLGIYNSVTTQDQP